MSFRKKQLIFGLLVGGGIGMMGTGAAFFEQPEIISSNLCFYVAFIGCAMLVCAVIFAHKKMRCSFCHRIYPLVGVEWWWKRTEYCPYCGEPFD